MRIAQIAPLFEAVPPKLYGGTERVVFSLTEALVAMGHDVTLFASGDSHHLRQAGRPLAARAAPRPRHPRLGRHLRAADRIRAPARRPVRRAAFPYRLLAELGVPPPGRAVRDHPARPPRPARVRRRLPHVPDRAAGVDLRQPAQAAAGCRLGGHGLSRHAGEPADAAAGRRSATTSPSSAASRPRKGIERAIQIAGALRREAEGRRQGGQGGRRILQDTASSRCWPTPMSSSSARSTTPRSPPSCPAPRRCCSRSTGRSRSAW